MEQLHAFDCHQNVAEPQATENHIKYTHVYIGTVNQAWLYVNQAWYIQACCTQAGPAHAACDADGMDR